MPMKPIFAALLMLSSMAVGKFGSSPRVYSDEELPRLEALGLLMVPNSNAIVGACECHSPFSVIMGGERIVSIDGMKTGSVRDVRVALASARSREAIPVVVQSAFKFDGRFIKRTEVVNVPAGRWLAAQSQN